MCDLFSLLPASIKSDLTTRSAAMHSNTLVLYSSSYMLSGMDCVWRQTSVKRRHDDVTTADVLWYCACVLSLLWMNWLNMMLQTLVLCVFASFMSAVVLQHGRESFKGRVSDSIWFLAFCHVQWLYSLKPNACLCLFLLHLYGLISSSAESLQLPWCPHHSFLLFQVQQHTFSFPYCGSVTTSQGVTAAEQTVKPFHLLCLLHGAAEWEETTW